MNINEKSFSTPVLIVCLTLFILLGRFCYVGIFSLNSTLGKDSPDECYLAEVSDFNRPGVFGGQYSRGDFQIRDIHGTLVWRKTLSHPGFYLDWKGFGKIAWEPDSSRVSFIYNQPSQFVESITLTITSPPLTRIEKKNKP